MREQLLPALLAVRRAQRRQPDDADLATTRAELERALGPTLGRAASARLLGVSQTALDRWIAHGEVPTVLTPSGRRAVPLAVVLDLLDALAQRPEGERHPLAAVLRASSNDAGAQPPRTAGGHRRAEQRALDYHRAVARRLDDRTVADALARLRRWEADRRIHPRYAREWDELLTGPRARLREAIAADDHEAAALRQSSPLAGALGEPERRTALGLA